MKADPSTKQGLNGLGPAEDRRGVFLLVAAFALMTLCWSTSASAEPLSDDKRYFNIPQQRADLSLTQFAEQAGLTLLFKFNIAKRKTANNLTGHYTVNEAVEVLLANTGLHPVFSDQGQLMSVSDDMPETEGGGMDTKKKAGLVAVLAGVLVGGVNAQEPTTTDTEIQTSVVTGKVTDARTGANLKGAKVTIEETGQWTSTNDLGEFRFVNVPTGSATLTVSYLGYAGQSAVVGVHGDGTSQNFSLRGGTEMDEVVVFGQRSARAQALNLERTAENVSTVVSSDLLGAFEGVTLSEALRRAPGVSFDIDFATGEGQNILVRGFAPDLNTVKWNGIELPVGNGFGRSADLGNILADSVGQIIISKTLLPNQDSAGIGGLVEIETKSPLDRPKRFANVSVEGGQRGDDFYDDLLVSGTLSGVFGRGENLGLSASVQFRDQTISSFQSFTNPAFGLYLPLSPAGTPTINSNGFVDPRSSFPFESGEGADEAWYTSYDINGFQVDIETLAASLSAEYRVANHTNLRFSYQATERKEDSLSTRSSIFQRTGYTLQPVERLGGQERFALTWFPSGDGFSIFQSGLSQFNHDVSDRTDIYSLRGDTKLDSWDFNYGLAYTDGSAKRPDSKTLLIQATDSSIPEMFLSSEAFDAVEGRPISLFSRPGQGLPVRVLVTPDGSAFLKDPDRFSVGAVFGNNRFGSNDRFAQNLSARRDFDVPYLSYIEFGMQLEQSRFESIVDRSGFWASNGATAADLDLEFSDVALNNIGLIDQGFTSFSRQTLTTFLSSDRLSELADEGLLLDFSGELDPLEADEFTEEDEVAAYIQTRFDIGAFELIGGFRLSTVDVRAANIYSPSVLDEFGQDVPEISERFREVVEGDASQSNVLPRFSVNYRPSDRSVIRFGYSKSVARPQIELLSRPTTVSLDQRQRYGPNRDQWRISINENNPDLEPAITQNYDLSVEHYFANSGVVKVGAFFKSVDNILETNSTVGIDILEGAVLPDDPVFTNVEENAAAAGTSVFVQRNKPVNAEDTAEAWGFDIAYEQQFDRLPGALRGLGVFFNYVYTDSSLFQNQTWFNKPTFDNEGNIVDFSVEDYRVKTNFDESPKYSGTLALTYSANGWDSNLAYSFQDVRRNGFSDFGLSAYNDSIETLDLRMVYQFGLGPSLSSGSAVYRVVFEAADLLSNTDDPTQSVFRGGANGAQTAQQSVTYNGGRQFRIGLSGTF